VAIVASRRRGKKTTTMRVRLAAPGLTSKPTYIALLRAVNVGGNLLKMERVRTIWSAAGFTNVRTYLQSGNVIFEANNPPADGLAELEQDVLAALDHFSMSE
jgi:uncharacterized protein (DUF1697 family)